MSNSVIARSEATKQSTWKECKLGEVLNFGNGKSRPKIEGEYPIYGGNGILGYANEFNYHDETIILGRVGAYCGSVYFENKPIWISDNALSAKPKKGNHTKFLYYFLKQMDLNSHAGGSSHPLITQSLLNSLDVEICTDYEEQKAIAEVLGSLDDKIDLLHRQNKTLEKLAQTFFRQWFVEGEETISYLFEELVDSISVKHSFKNDKVIFLNTSDVYDGKVLHDNYSTVSGLPGQAKKSIKKGDILFTEIRPANKRFAFIDFEADDYVVSTKLMVLRSKNVLDTSIVYLFLKQQDTLNYLQMLAESRSGTFPQITFDHLKTVEIFVPKDNDILESTTNIFKDIVTKTFSNHAAIKTLENMRDTLLPKLMSGEVRVEI